MTKLTLFMTILAGGLMACQTAPVKESSRNALDDNVQATVTSMNNQDTSFQSFLNNAYGYAVYPTAGKGGLVVGGAYGRGEVFEQGRLIGYSDMTQATLGGQIGGQEFSEVIVFENKMALDKFIANSYEPAAQASAVILKTGAAASAKYADGIVVFAQPKAGVMAEAVVGGQRFRFVPLENVDHRPTETAYSGG